MRCAAGDLPFQPLDDHDWPRLPSDADAHHLAPLLEWLTRGCESSAPRAVRAQLRALVLRQTAWHRARTAAATEILDALERGSIRTLVLKGAALAWTIYPSPALRPMTDIDLLVDRSDAAKAQTVIRQLGFDAAPPRPFGGYAHHLPSATRVDGGLPITVEIHLDALTRDSGQSIAPANLVEPPRRFLLDGASRMTLGHIDTLRHLVHHMLEPSPDGFVRLISLVDLLRYARAFHAEIDWPRMEAAFPFVLNALACVHAIVPLTGELARCAAPDWWRPADAGQTLRPLRWIAREASVLAIVRELFVPPAWWMHAYYNVRPGRSLLFARAVRHPTRMIRWLALRVGGF
ncbi:MAG TPA: nucleotidyltransferase family protein [Vicinamibacterales bacterium]|nr:nucleotidyltransferase family protein [Vicinamibacterales bacterium]